MLYCETAGRNSEPEKLIKNFQFALLTFSQYPHEYTRILYVLTEA
jgi:hypothetical protein